MPTSHDDEATKEASIIHWFPLTSFIPILVQATSATAQPVELLHLGPPVGLHIRLGLARAFASSSVIRREALALGDEAQ